jgi:molybdate transport system substrate-binding protein
MRKARTIWVVAVAVLAGSLLAACSGGGAGQAFTVYAPSSLADAFRALAAVFEDSSPGLEVDLHLADSASLREQILSGSTADVYVSVGSEDMDLMEEAGKTAGSPQVLALNPLAIAVPFGNPAGVTGLEDFADPDLAIGLCSEELPLGVSAREALAAAEVTPSLDANESEVRFLLNKIETGELDAGIIYASDVVGEAGYVDGIIIPDAYQVELGYSIAALSGAPNLETGQQFVDFVLSAEGQQVLAEFGLTSP